MAKLAELFSMPIPILSPDESMEEAISRLVDMRDPNIMNMQNIVRTLVEAFLDIPVDEREKTLRIYTQQFINHVALQRPKGISLTMTVADGPEHSRGQWRLVVAKVRAQKPVIIKA